MINDFYASDEEYYLPGVQLYRGINNFFSISRPLSVYINNKMEYYVLIEKVPAQFDDITKNINCRIFLTKPEYYIAGKSNEILSRKELGLFIKVLNDRWSHVNGFLQDVYNVSCNIPIPDYYNLPISDINNNYIPDNCIDYYDKEYYYYLPYHHLNCPVLDGYDAPDDEECSRWIDLAQDLHGHMFITGVNHTPDKSDMYVTVIKNGPYDDHYFRRAFNEYVLTRISILNPKYIHIDDLDEVFTQKELIRFNQSIHNNWNRVLNDIHETYYYEKDDEFNKLFSNLQCPDYSSLETADRINGFEFF